MLQAMNNPIGIIQGLFIGKPEPRWSGKPPSAIGKYSVTGPLTINSEGLEGDEQADLRFHGGTEKAIHHYAADHFDFWKQQFADNAVQFVPGCFGENVSTTGLTEDNVCIGDILKLGSAVVQLTQGRQPCWKLNKHTGINAMAAQFQKTTRTGWYYRVLEIGQVEAGDTIKVIDRIYPKWPLKEVILARFNPSLDPDIALELSRLVDISENWRNAFMKKHDRNYVENTDVRLIGP